MFLLVSLKFQTSAGIDLRPPASLISGTRPYRRAPIVHRKWNERSSASVSRKSSGGRCRFSGGKIVGIRFAIIDFPDPGGPMQRIL
jgi:hypothetical protein